MSKDTARAALATLTDDEAEALNSSPELLSKFRQKHGLDGSQSQPEKSFSDIAKEADATQLIQQAAPSNLLKKVGIASANAPGIAGAIINSLPGIGNPQQIMPSLQNIQANPGQASTALKRIVATQAGDPLRQKEILPASIGQAAGTALEMTAPNLSTEGVSASGPFSAGIKRPSTALPGTFDEAQNALGAARSAARAADDADQASRFRVLLRLPAGQAKLAEEGKSAIEAGKDLSVTQLEAYGEALGKMQERGGAFADDYAKARAMAREMLQWKAPDLVNKIEESAVNYAAKGDPRAFPWLIGSLNPKVGIAKLATLPAVQNAIGAGTGMIAQGAPQVAPVADLFNSKSIRDGIAKSLLKKRNQ